eukprot:scaffold27289_cov52-Phaeocystis_antarctica.AAC.1
MRCSASRSSTHSSGCRPGSPNPNPNPNSNPSPSPSPSPSPNPNPNPNPNQDRLLLIIDLSGWGISHGPLVSSVLSLVQGAYVERLGEAAG